MSRRHGYEHTLRRVRDAIGEDTTPRPLAYAERIARTVVELRTEARRQRARLLRKTRGNR